MKKITIISAIILLATFAHARGTQWVTKEKKLHRTFTVQPSGRLSVTNSFGNIVIHTWDRNEVVVDVTMTAKGRTDNKATNMLDHVFMEESGGNNQRITFKSGVESGYSISDGNEIRINYIINMPKRNSLDLENKFGNVDLEDILGNVDLAVSFGELHAQNISGSANDMELSFGSSTIKSIEGGKLKVQHGGVDIDRIQNIKMDNSFSKVNISSANKLKIIHKFGTLKIGFVDDIDGVVNHSDLEIDHLQKRADLGLNYNGSSVIRHIDGSAENIKIGVGYSTLSCYFDQDTNLDIDVKTEFGSFKNRASSSYVTMTNTDENGNTQYYKGKAGKGRGIMDITGNYSTVFFK